MTNTTMDAQHYAAKLTKEEARILAADLKVLKNDKNQFTETMRNWLKEYRRQRIGKRIRS